MKKLVSIAAACERMEMSERTFRRLLGTPGFPQPVRRSKRWVRIVEDDITNYLQALIEGRPPQPGPPPA